jgi:uncharacterized membrane protein (UPF0127 family)
MAHFLNRRRMMIAALLLIPLAAAAAVILVACGRVIKDDKVAEVTLDGKKFHLELALDGDTRFHGLSNRDKIADDGGMLFVFPQPVTTSFVMRDCPIPIDIIFLDGSGRIVAMHKMVAEPPRGPDETEIDKESQVNKKYEDRLKKYPSNFATQFVIELKGNTLDGLKLKKTDKIELDLVELKKRAK